MPEPTASKGVACVGPVALSALRQAAEELTARDPGFRSEYVGFNDGGWQAAALWNASGDAEDRIVGDGLGQPTSLAARLPAACSVLDGLIERYGLRVTCARLARMCSGARVWEHRDFLELADPHKLRLHVPIITNPSALLHFSDVSVHLALGYLWQLDGSVAHAASNDGPPRVHLIVDCQPNAWLSDRLIAPPVEASWLLKKAPLSNQALTDLAAKFRELASTGDLAAAERMVLEAFLTYDLGVTNSFQMVAELCQRNGLAERARHWALEEREKLVERR